MGEIALLVVLCTSIVGAIGTYIYNRTSSRGNRERHDAVIKQGDEIKERVEESKVETESNNRDRQNAVIRQGNEVKDQVQESKIETQKGVEEIKKEITKNEKLFVTPSEIIIPAKAERDVSLVITNSKPFPIFMGILEFEVEEGDIDLSNDCLILPFETGLHKPKYMSYQISQINAGSTANLLVKVDGKKYMNASRVKVKLSQYMKEPGPNFSMSVGDSLPKTITVPKDFVPKFYKNE